MTLGHAFAEAAGFTSCRRLGPFDAFASNPQASMAEGWDTTEQHGMRKHEKNTVYQLMTATAAQVISRLRSGYFLVIP